jgi:segregation and condensation protein A
MRLRLESFDGPLDLLLHLIKSQEINIFNIPIRLICGQYMQYLREEPNLNYMLAGEYLAMAANLIELKAMTLIPALQGRLADAASLEEISDSDPRKPLVQALLQYELIRDAAVQLEARSLRESFPSGEFKRRREEFEQVSEELTGNAFTLVIVLERLLLKFSEQKRNETRVSIQVQKITIQSKMLQVQTLLLNRTEPLEFKEFLPLCESRYELIVTIMALLELAKSRHVSLHQTELYGPLFIEKGESYESEVPVVPDDETNDTKESVIASS